MGLRAPTAVAADRLKQWRGIATRYAKTAESYQAAITLASLLLTDVGVTFDVNSWEQVRGSTVLPAG